MSELELRNNASGRVLTVTPALRLPDGTETILAPVIIQPQEVKSVDLDAAIAAANAPQLAGAFGSVVLRYSAPFLAGLYASMMIHRIGYPIALHFHAAGESQQLQSGGREGVWWLPKETTSGYLVVTNRGSNIVPLALSVYDAGGHASQQAVTLGPGQMSRYSIRALVQAAGLAGSYGGIKISANAHAGSLDTLHILFDETAGFSATLKMFDYDPGATVQQRDYARTSVWTLRAAMLALSSPDPALAFPPGTTLQPQLFIRNTTAKPINASLRFNWRDAATTGKAAGPSLQLNPFETRLIDIAALQDGTTLPKQAIWTSVTITTDSKPDEVVALGASYDATLRYGAQAPFSDQLTFEWEGGMWEYGPYHDTLITAGNGGTKPIQAAFTIFYNQGAQRYDLEQTLQPDEQMWIDVGTLISQQVPDKNGKSLPADLATGSYQLRDLTNKGVGTLFEGQVTYDKTYGYVAYGCAGCCGYDTPYFLYNPLAVSAGGSAGQSVVAPNQCDGGTVEDVSDSFTGNWSTGNTSIVTVDEYGTHYGVSVGSTSSQTYGYLNDNKQMYSCPLFLFRPSGTDNVTPTITSISPTKGPVGSTVTVTIMGAGFGSSPSVSAGSSITATVNSASNSQIVASFAISATASGGNQSVTVTANGQQSNSVNFLIQVPTSLAIVPGTNSTTTQASCTTSGGLTGCGVTRSFTYQVYDQTGSPLQFGGLQVWDSYGTPSPNPLNMTGFATTCGGTGPCGAETDAAGQFQEIALYICAPACYLNGKCITGGPSVVTQTWHVGPASIAQTISYYCDHVLVNGQ